VRVLVAVAIWIMLPLLLASVVSSPYVAVSGVARDVGVNVMLPKVHRRSAGWMAFTTVTFQKLSYLQALVAAVGSGPRLLTGSPEGDHQFGSSKAAQARAMENSKASAICLALRHAGYTVDVDLQGVLVDSMRKDSAAAGKLEPGDVILKVDGEPVPSVTAFAERLVTSKSPSAVELDVLRASQRHIVIVNAERAAREDIRTVMGLVLESWIFGAHVPFEIAVKTDDIYGASAGLMFALGLLDALTPGDLTGSHRVAGTGTLTVDGDVGAVAGVADKARAAEQAQADVFVVPRDNAAEATAAAQRMRVIPVATLDEALQALRQMGGKVEAP
jgi:PDZ domain-containing protein